MKGKKELTFRLLAVDDVPQVLDLMEQAAFPLAGLSCRSLYSSLCKDGLSCEKMLIGVAESEGQVAGFLMIIVDWKAYWQRFLLRHPLLALRMIRHRLSRRQAKERAWDRLNSEQREQINKALASTPSGRHWKDSSDSIAKGVFMQIDPAFRRRGIGVKLYDCLFDILSSRGVRRCDAKVDVVNTSALPLHIRVGYRLEATGNTLFATIDLPRVVSDDKKNSV